MQLVFQDPYASLNPRRTVGDIVADPMRINKIGSDAEINKRVRDLFETVGLDPAALRRYPHEFSGGQRQRIGIARSLSLNPSLVVADEPVSALDVSVQAQVLNLMTDLQDEFKLTYLFIAHDLGVVRHVSDRVGVMYLGEIVELGGAEALYETPHAPYTEALLSVVPELNDTDAPRRERIIISGDVPDPARIVRRAVRSIPVARRRPRSARPTSQSSSNCARDVSWPVTIRATSDAASHRP